MTREQLEHAIRAACDVAQDTEYRHKDRDFVRTLLVEGVVKARVLTERIHAMAVEEDVKERLAGWVRATAGELQ